MGGGVVGHVKVMAVYVRDLDRSYSQRFWIPVPQECSGKLCLHVHIHMLFYLLGNQS